MICDAPSAAPILFRKHLFKSWKNFLFVGVAPFLGTVERSNSMLSSITQYNLQEPEVFADGFAGPRKEPGIARHRPAGLAVGPDGERWVPIHGVLPLSRARECMAALQAHLESSAAASARASSRSR